MYVKTPTPNGKIVKMLALELVRIQDPFVRPTPKYASQVVNVKMDMYSQNQAESA